MRPRLVSVLLTAGAFACGPTAQTPLETGGGPTDGATGADLDGGVGDGAEQAVTSFDGDDGAVDDGPATEGTASTGPADSGGEEGPNPTTTGGGDPEQTCVTTGGQWDEFSCGHYTCGVPSPDACIDPGCNCGPFANFDAELGCLEDPSCFDTPCASAGDCAGGEICGAGCCVPFPGWCSDPIAELAYAGSCTVSVETGGVSWLVVPDCGLGTEGGIDPCDGGDGVQWIPAANGPWTLVLCGAYCEGFAATGSLELYMFCGD